MRYNDTTGPFSVGSARVTQSIEVRSRSISAPGLPTAPFIENIGVQPDVSADYQTVANLFTGGQPFVQGFSALIANLAGPDPRACGAAAPRQRTPSPR